ncbi:MAG: hypothetical protein H0W44_06465 [Gammaproteobacteria bacterium]|nr:hypothetical protein [Gammaproteobacteria bacterium]
MFKRISKKLLTVATRWLNKDLSVADRIALTDFDSLLANIRFADVLLVEGQTRVSSIIRTITMSPWTHAGIYIGPLTGIQDEKLRELILQHYPAQPDEPLVVEALLGRGTVITSLAKYRGEHLRICRPKGLSSDDAHAVVAYSISRLGTEYDVRQLIDLARFLAPYPFIPKRWHSTLFGESKIAKTVCSTMLAEAFASVRFPIRPIFRKTAAGDIRMYRRNFRLYTPSDFDYSPYFEIVKAPIFGQQTQLAYRDLPWEEQDSAETLHDEELQHSAIKLK